MIKNETKFGLADKIICIVIGVTILLATIMTIVWVNYKYAKSHKEEFSSYTAIPNNNKYRYKLEDNKISFYDGKKVVDTYNCLTDCKIASNNNKDEFIINYDSFIPIYDNDKYNVYNIEMKNTYYIFDTYPKKTDNSEFGLTTYNNLYGLINNKGGQIFNTEYTDIQVTDNFIVTLKNNILSIYNNKSLTKPVNEVPNITEIVVSEKDNYLYIYTTDIYSNRDILKYDTIINKYIAE